MSTLSDSEKKELNFLNVASKNTILSNEDLKRRVFLRRKMLNNCCIAAGK